ncbi:MAG: transcription-repair coupling factor [Bacteriovoracia bacterium]
MNSGELPLILKQMGTLPVFRLGGALPSAQAYLCRQLPHSLSIVVCQDEDAATVFAQNLQALSLEDSDAPLVLSLPSWEQSPYSAISPSIQVRQSRARALAHVLENQDGGSGRGLLDPTSRGLIVVTTLVALSQRTCPPSLFREARIVLEKNGVVGQREQLTSRLRDAGYLQVDPVEDPGTFAVRGDIVDVYPPQAEAPLRIELFDDQVERIREFDPATQRTRTGVEHARFVIYPAREVLIHPSNREAFRQRLKQRADDLGIPRQTRDPVLETLANGFYPEGADYWSALAYEGKHVFRDFLGKNATFFFSDELGCRQAFEAFQVRQRELSEEAKGSGRVVLDFPDIFSKVDAEAAAFDSYRRVYFDALELADRALDVRVETSPIVANSPDTARGAERMAQFAARIKSLGASPTLLGFASTQSQIDRMQYLFQENGLPPARWRIGAWGEGFAWPAQNLAVFSQADVLGETKKPSTTAPKQWSGLQNLSDLNVDDTIVHVEHGIGVYRGISRLQIMGGASDFLLIEYDEQAKLYLPVYRINLIQKYVGGREGMKLAKLGAGAFEKTKAKVRDSVKKLAINLLEVYAQRKIQKGLRFPARDAIFQEFEDRFPFQETPDQTQAIEDSFRDLESGRIMDRLICGDVGFGKTEVAIRAAFQAVISGKQVAVLVPTTILCIQHEQTFKNRIQKFPIRVESISRFKTRPEQQKLLQELAEGKIDVLIGTHRLLSKDVNFKKLGLIIVDEEHRFGVEHKEKLRAMKANTHVMTLTATPIPRTLHMALAGIRDISLMTTPPVHRLPIKTFVAKYDETLIKQAIETELARDGQVFFLHNRVQTIFRQAEKIQALVPAAKVRVGHAQMTEKELEDTMLAFYRKEFNVLVCTTIIESGLDIPSANTILINHADRFGLAQLYQLRGRVGRSNQRGYAYLLLSNDLALTEDAKRRLEVIQRFVELGSGFQIASHDLEIRGGGNVLGPEQSGNIASVGFELYTELLDEAIRELQGKGTPLEDPGKEPEIKTPFPAFLDDRYIPDVHQRLSVYRRLAGAAEEAELVAIEEELADRYGKLPTEAENLLWVIRLKQLLKRSQIESMTVGDRKYTLKPGAGHRFDPQKILQAVRAEAGRIQVMPDSRLVVALPPEQKNSIKDLAFHLEKTLANF